MSHGLIVLVLSLLLGLQPITTDLYLPALPTITQVFGAAMPQAQLTLSALLLAFGLSQLVWGPLSDRFGRRPVLHAAKASRHPAQQSSKCRKFSITIRVKSANLSPQNPTLALR